MDDRTRNREDLPEGVKVRDSGRPDESERKGRSGSRGPEYPKERRSKAVGWNSGDVLRAALLVIALYVLFQALWFAHALFFAAFLGVLFGLAIGAGVDKLERFRIPRALGAVLILFSVFGALGGTGALLAPTLREQGRELRERLPEAIDEVEQFIERWQGGLVGTVIDDAAGAGEQAGGGDTAAAGQEPTREPAQDPVQQGEAPAAGRAEGGGPLSTPSLRERVGQQLGGLTGYLFPFITTTVTAIAGFLLVIALSMYIAVNPDLYHRGLMHLFPHKHRRRAGEVLSAMARVLRRWFITQLIGMAIIAIVTTGALLALGIPAAFALGLIAGLLEFIPTIGPWLAGAPAVLMGLLDSPQKALMVGGVFVVIQTLESHLLTPLLMQEGIELPPALTVMVQALMAILFGFIGLLVAVPLLAAVLVPIKMLYVEDVVGDDVMEDLDSDDEDDDEDPADDPRVPPYGREGKREQVS